MKRAYIGKTVFLGACGALLCLASASGSVHTYGGTDDLSRIDVTAVYYLPKGRTPVPDWRERMNYMARRIEQFHRREFSGQSEAVIHLPAAPLQSTHTVEDLRSGDATRMFWTMVNDARGRLGWPGPARSGFPVLLLFSDTNWRELDDFRRLRVVDGVPRHEGAIGEEGRHFPGAESGGSRAAFIKHEKLGVALVTADGWRVPYTGSDCVAYHEGLGHVLGLPHPEPGNGSVMSQAQYRYNINQAWIDEDQKLAMGWAKPPSPPSLEADLFTKFTAKHQPAVPLVGQEVRVDLTWPAGAAITGLTAEVQTDLFGPWLRVPAPAGDGGCPSAIRLGAFQAASPVSYRIRVALADGRQEEIWGYFQVRNPLARSFWYDYQFDPPGKRLWSTDDSEIWTERGPGGLDLFRVEGSTNVGGMKGVSAIRQYDNGLEVFIPDRQRDANLMFRFPGKTEWNRLGTTYEYP